MPNVCDRGVKKNSKGYIQAWNGFKLHADVNDLGLPLSTVLTSTSVHDSQVAIPLTQLTSNKVPYCYAVMDAAYDSAAIKMASKQNDHEEFGLKPIEPPDNHLSGGSIGTTYFITSALPAIT